MNQTISHTGIVQQVLQNQVVVSIASQSACSACHAKGACGVLDEQEKCIYVSTQHSNKFFVGQQVDVYISESSAMAAVWYAYILPFLVVISVLLISNIFVSEPLAAAFTIAFLILYYIVLSKYKDSIHKKIMFHIAHTA